VVTPLDPIAKFEELFARASHAAPFDPVAVTLATSSASGQPSARVVLLRRFDREGFVFFTNYKSQKGRDLDENPRASLCCYWPWIDEQARVEGRVTKVTAAESDEYFAGRPRGSQLAAWASDQSEPLGSRAELEQRYLTLEARYAGRDVPRPPHWGGYRIVPERVEFWRAGTYRMHDRLLFVRDGDAWRTEALNP
jgi:pyridoxamine 5'-phosphate oxidase